MRLEKIDGVDERRRNVALIVREVGSRILDFPDDPRPAERPLQPEGRPENQGLIVAREPGAKLIQQCRIAATLTHFPRQSGWWGC